MVRPEGVPLPAFSFYNPLRLLALPHTVKSRCRTCGASIVKRLAGTHRNICVQSDPDRQRNHWRELKKIRMPRQKIGRGHVRDGCILCNLCDGERLEVFVHVVGESSSTKVWADAIDILERPQER